MPFLPMRFDRLCRRGMCRSTIEEGAGASKEQPAHHRDLCFSGNRSRVDGLVDVDARRRVFYALVRR